MRSLDRRRAIGAGFLAVSGQPLLTSLGRAERQRPDGDVGAAGWISVFDPRFGGGAKGDGKTDDTIAIAAAAFAAMESGRSLYMAGRFAVANLKLPGAGPLLVVGHPIFVQAIPDTPCLLIEDQSLQQMTGCRMTCTVIPHPSSSKANPHNVALNLTGFSSSEISVSLGKADRHTAGTGRFNTVVYADAASPFHYGNRIRVIADAVPASRYCVRYANRGRGVNANPNLNVLSGWFYALDTVKGDVLLDVADSTQTIIEGPTLIEQCPNAIGISAGNFTTIRDVWFEQVGVAIDFAATKDTVANNCWVERCNFSGQGHEISISDAVGAAPVFDHCLGDFVLTPNNRSVGRTLRPLRLHSHEQPPAPTIRSMKGVGKIAPDQASLRHVVESTGRTTYQLRYILEPASSGTATIRLTPAKGWEIEQATLGLRDSAGRIIPSALGDDLAGTDYEWTWGNPGPHILNVRVTLRPLG